MKNTDIILTHFQRAGTITGLPYVLCLGAGAAHNTFCSVQKTEDPTAVTCPKCRAQFARFKILAAQAAE